MKKLICLLLVLLIGTCCASGIAESQNSSFLQIRENVTAKVYANPGDTDVVDTLESGRICGLLDETTAAKKIWFHIFYLDSQKQGQLGYISFEDADILTQDELSLLSDDPVIFNEVLDLIDALNSFMNVNVSDEKEEEANSSENQKKKSSLKKFYEKAVGKLKTAVNTVDKDILSDATASAKKIGRKIADAGGDLLDKAKDQVKSTAKDLNKKLKDIDVKEKLNDLKKTLDDADLGEKISDQVEKISDQIKKLDKQSVLDKVTEVKDKVIETKEKISELTKKDSGLRVEIDKAISELRDLFGKGN